MAIKNEIIDELLKDKDPKTIFTSEGLLGELKKALAERVLNAEMDHHLADSTQAGVSEGEKAGNHRNGYSKKTVLTESEAIELSIPRDRRGDPRCRQAEAGIKPGGAAGVQKTLVVSNC